MLDSPTADTTENLAEAVIDVNATDSSGVEHQDKGSENKSTLDVVKSALRGSDKSPTSENGQKPEAAPPAETQNPEATAKAVEEAWVKSLSKDGQNRFRDLANANRELNQQLPVFKEKADQFDRLNTQIQQHRLSPDDVSNTLEIAGLLRSDPEQALQKLTPIVRNLLKQVGVELPDDLQAEVAAGKLPPTRAQELAAERNRNERLVQQQELERQEQAQRQQQDTINAMRSVADTWTAERRTSDPDWHLKQGRVVELVKLHLLENKDQFPRTEQAARELFQNKLKVVEDDMKRLAPRPQPAREMAGNSSPAAKAAPKNTLDVIKASLSGNS